MNESLVHRVRTLLRAYPAQSGPGGERFARAALGYSPLSPRTIQVAPVGPPAGLSLLLNDALPGTDGTGTGSAREPVFEDGLQGTAG